MSTDLFSLIRTCVDTTMAETIRPLLNHRQEWEKVADSFEDKADRELYLTELAFQTLNNILGTEKALEMAMTFPLSDWKEAQDAARQAYDQNLIPKFANPFQEDHPILWADRTENFILNQYRHPSGAGFHEGDVFLDCGAGFGDTALWAKLWGAKKIYAFEPSPSNYVWLEKNALTWDSHRQFFFPVRLAVSNQTEWLPFTETPESPEDSHLGGNGEIMVNTVDLDSWCTESEVKPDCIKMDVQGTEGLALMGAEKLIRNYKPRLVISMYHHIEDMWILPLLIKSFVPEYRFWCKKSHPINKLVLFAAV